MRASIQAAFGCDANSTAGECRCLVCAALHASCTASKRRGPIGRPAPRPPGGAHVSGLGGREQPDLSLPAAAGGCHPARRRLLLAPSPPRPPHAAARLLLLGVVHAPSPASSCARQRHMERARMRRSQSRDQLQRRRGNAANALRTARVVDSPRGGELCRASSVRRPHAATDRG